ncbi:hypothetical protein ACNHUS_14015 [Actinomycetes bacterium M1A6_2h]
MDIVMRRAAVTCAVVAAVISGCGSQDAPTPEVGSGLPALGAPVTAPSPTSAPITDSGVLTAAMITVGDLPTGYVSLELPPADLADPTTGAEQPDESSTDPAECAAVLAPVSSQSVGATATAAVAYSGPDFASIDEDAASYSGGGSAATFAAMQNTLRRCGTFSGTDADGVRVDYRVGALDAPRVGDASSGARVEITSDGLTLTSDLVIVVVGSTVVQLTATAQEPMESDVLDAVAAAAVGRLGGAGR